MTQEIKPADAATAAPEPAPTPLPITFADFLKDVGPSVFREVTGLWKSKQGQYHNQDMLSTPEVVLECQDASCGGMRTFRFASGDINFGTSAFLNTFLNYLCSNCRKQSKRFALQVFRKTDQEGEGKVFKYGESPAFGPSTPARLIRLFGNDKDLFLKGRRSEIQGLGIGAFGYYRRVVESHKNQIFDEVIRVSEAVGLPPEKIETLKRAKTEIQFTKALEAVKDAMPETLMINGQNPFTLLHGALSVHIHERSDAECLELAQAVRVVLIELAEKMSAALKDEADLSDAVNKLMKARQS